MSVLVSIQNGKLRGEINIKKKSNFSNTPRRSFSDTSLQTDSIMKSEKGVMSHVQENKEVQICEPEISKVTEVDVQKLASWLNKTLPVVKEELDHANRSQAFRDYISHAHSIDASTCSLIQSIDLSRNNPEQVFKITGISWNKMGKYLALVSCQEHTTWCYHTGFISIYALSRTDEIIDLPHMELTTESCVTNVEFHPHYSDILAAATHAGSIFIWNIENGDKEILVSLSNVHDYPINQIQWTKDFEKSRESILATSSHDGFIKLWNFGSSSTFQIKNRYEIKLPPTQIQNYPTDSHNDADVERGVLCFDFSMYNPKVIIAGLEGGVVLQTSELEKSEMKAAHSLCKYYERHNGDVINIKFCPNCGDRFLTSGNDSEIRIYSCEQEQPIQILYLKQPLFDVCFVPHEELIVMGCNSKSLPEFFNIKMGRCITLQTSENLKTHQVICMAIHSRRSDLVALGTATGKLLLWNVQWRLHT